MKLNLPFPHARSPRPHHARQRGRRGVLIIWLALFLVAALAFCALSVDTGYIYLARTELQRSTDAGSLAGAGALMDGEGSVHPQVVAMMAKNLVGGRQVTPGEVEAIKGKWDDEAHIFTPDDDSPNAVRVVVNIEKRPLFFGAILGNDTFGVQARATAVFQPRDVMVVLDYSGSMNDDSELKHIPEIGRVAVEANLLEIYQDLGSPQLGAMQWQPQYIRSSNSRTILRTLGLERTPYPYPSGSWSDYFSYVRSSSYVRNAGYNKRYGYLTLMNYLLEKKPKSNQTPDLWRTREQPITAVKNAVSVFLAYVQQVESDDQVGLSVYTAADGTARLESGLTKNMQVVEDISRQRQAGHYDTMTNIGAGLQKARIELEDNARSGSFKMIVLMTDGIANRPSNTTQAKRFLLQEAQKCADNKYKVLTVSLGSGADKNLMQQVANITSGMHFNIPGGQSVAAYEEDLEDVFREIAAHRPLRLAN